MKAHRDRLPTGYAEFASQPASYRRAIYAALAPSARSDLWVAHFAHYRTTHPHLSAEQSAVLNDATRLAPHLITSRRQTTAAQALETAAIAAFGESGAQAILRTLGPADTHETAPRSDQNIQVMDCNSQCAGTGSCDMVCYASPWWCNWTDYSCGPLWLGPCNGVCAP
ncbi:bacteriocin fulvocin C-related protein [Streptomyces sp. NPDC050534]|uniref:bacteriocin fulvocin C-related protein n=1 Tax=Streptomyces sp. NPDC050534 TaxID=3365625 RepID=UPI0037A3A1E9